LLKSRWGYYKAANPQQETRFTPCTIGTEVTKYKGEYTMIYKLKQKVRANWKPVLEMIFSTLLMACLIALVTVDFFSLGG
jgi:hypothetical protein